MADRLGVAVSSLCVVTCLAPPAMALAFPVMRISTEAEWAHWLFFILAAALAFLALLRPQGRSWLLAAFALSGVALLLAGLATAVPHEATLPVTVIGALILAGAHIANWRRRRRSAGS